MKQLKTYIEDTRMFLENKKNISDDINAIIPKNEKDTEEFMRGLLFAIMEISKQTKFPAPKNVLSVFVSMIYTIFDKCKFWIQYKDLNEEEDDWEVAKPSKLERTYLLNSIKDNNDFPEGMSTGSGNIIYMLFPDCFEEEVSRQKPSGKVEEIKNKIVEIYKANM